jgi:hypothetical protein
MRHQRLVGVTVGIAAGVFAAASDRLKEKLWPGELLPLSWSA